MNESVETQEVRLRLKDEMKHHVMRPRSRCGNGRDELSQEKQPAEGEISDRVKADMRR